MLGFYTTKRYYAAIRTVTLPLLVALFNITHLAEAAPVSTSAEIRRGADGIPHIRANDWHALGYGIGYAQAQDALCTLAEAFVTYAGKRSMHFGGTTQPAAPSTFGRPANLELDIFFRSFLTSEALGRFRAAQPVELLRLSEGYATGYNSFLNKSMDMPAECKGQPWLHAITVDDIMRRMMAVGMAGGYGKFISQIVNAAPPSEREHKTASTVAVPLARLLAAPVGHHRGLGSNALAFGEEAAGRGGAVLLANPHWYWGGPDRFYQMHLTLPGKLNVAGATFLGIPVVMIGFNDAVAWTHTVSSAKRFGIFELALADGRADHYMVDGTARPMSQQQVEVDVRAENGSMHRVSRTLYRTAVGPLIDLQDYSPELGWGPRRALAIKDANEENDRVFAAYLRWNMARSLEEFTAIQREEAATPWVHTLAIGAGDGRAWYADIGPAPNVPDELRAACPAAVQPMFAAVDPHIPVLDGTRSECRWRNDARAVRPGMMAWQDQPHEWRTDYVANMNGSYWPTSAKSTLGGYARTMGPEAEPLSMRTRLGHQIAAELMAVGPLSPPVLSYRLRDLALDTRSYAAQQYRTPVLQNVCSVSEIAVERDILDGKSFEPVRRVPTSEACRVLRNWKGTGNVADGGALLWDAFWNRVRQIPDEERYRVPFAPNERLYTPRDLNTADQRVLGAFGAAVLALQDAGIPLNAAMGDRLRAGHGKQASALYGGCEESGYFTIACDETGAYNPRSTQFFANSYLQVVHFTAEGPRAYTMLAHGERDWFTASGQPDSGLARYAGKRWLAFPFSATALRSQTNMTVTRLSVTKAARQADH